MSAFWYDSVGSAWARDPGYLLAWSGSSNVTDSVGLKFVAALYFALHHKAPLGRGQSQSSRVAD